MKKHKFISFFLIGCMLISLNPVTAAQHLGNVALSQQNDVVRISSYIDEEYLSI